MANLKTKEGRNKAAKYTKAASDIVSTFGEGTNPNKSLRDAWQPQDTNLQTEGSAKASKQASAMELSMQQSYEQQKAAVDNIITRQTAENITLLRPDEGGTKKTKKKKVDPYYG
tara:strand:+ start:381 stop:722 length:342 start_codon:yes stop_codon:yes gene_type:complete